MRGLVWFREDLRTQDNTALSHAAKHCDEGLVAVYIIDTLMWRHHNVATCRVEFILRGLEELKSELNKIFVPFIVLEVADTKFIATELNRLMDQFKLRALFFNKQYEINERRRDANIMDFFAEKKIETHTYDDQVILPPGRVKTLQGGDYSMFTPYKRAWLKIIFQQGIKLFPQVKSFPLDIASSEIPKKIKGFESHIDPELWPAGQRAANKRLQVFVENHLFHYDKQRDFPALDTTSKLSAYLATGMISPRQCFQAALIANNNELDTGNPGAITWMSELIWREFYKHILIATPRVSMDLPYKEKTVRIPWEYDEKLFLAWQQGQTGYPLIDAAMRQLKSIGWMHNRLRMVVAMFLTKNLFFNWQLGEKYFMLHLIDGDLAANNGGWQWSASTGTDSAPYFRIFNPIRQSERFDPEGTFIKTYCPELKDFDKKSIHEPYAHMPLIAAQNNYPQPIIDLRKNRDKVIAAFKDIE